MMDAVMSAEVALAGGWLESYRDEEERRAVVERQAQSFRLWAAAYEFQQNAKRPWSLVGRPMDRHIGLWSIGF